MLPSIIEKFGSIVPLDETTKLCEKDGFQGSAEQEAERHFAAVAKQFRSESPIRQCIHIWNVGISLNLSSQVPGLKHNLAGSRNTKGKSPAPIFSNNVNASLDAKGITENWPSLKRA